MGPQFSLAATLGKAVDAVNAATAILCNGLLVGITVVTVLQVFLRFALNSPTSWSEEIALLGLIWFGFFAIAIGIRRHQHVAVTFLRDLLPPAGAAALDYAAQIAIAVFMFTVAWFGRNLTDLVGAQLLPASQISKMWLYLPAIIGGGLGCLNAIANICLRDVHLAVDETTDGLDDD